MHLKMIQKLVLGCLLLLKNIKKSPYCFCCTVLGQSLIFKGPLVGAKIAWFCLCAVKTRAGVTRSRDALCHSVSKLLFWWFRIDFVHPFKFSRDVFARIFLDRIQENYGKYNIFLQFYVTKHEQIFAYVYIYIYIYIYIYTYTSKVLRSDCKELSPDYQRNRMQSLRYHVTSLPMKSPI